MILEIRGERWWGAIGSTALTLLVRVTELSQTKTVAKISEVP